MNSIFQSLISSGTNAIAGLATASSAFPYQEVRKIAVHGERNNQALIWDIAESNKVSFGNSNSTSSNHPNNIQSFLPQNHSVFSRILPKNSDLELELVKNGVKRWKMIRHPKCLAFKDGHQTDYSFSIATESVFPVNLDYCQTLDEASICWGLYQIALALQFLHKDCQLLHGNVRVGGSIFSDRSGQWKLAGFELTCSMKDSFIFKRGKTFFTNSSNYFPPEVSDDSWSALPFPDPIDSWYFGILMYEVFNGNTWTSACSKDPGKIPKILHSSYKGFLHPDPRARLSVSSFLESQKMQNGYFNNLFLKQIDFLDNYSVQPDIEKETFFSWIASHGLSSYPERFRLYKLIPILAHAIECSVVSSELVCLVIEASSGYSVEEYAELFLPILLKFAQHQDRSVRHSLLEKSGVFKSKLDVKLLSEKLFPLLVSGFSDPNPALREATLKSCIFLSDKLTETVINQELIKCLGRLQADEQPGIRTNTMIAIGKLTKNLKPAIRMKVLVPALSRAMQDPFTPCRNAALMAFIATLEFIEPADLTAKVLPLVCPLLIDSDGSVRKNALNSIQTSIKSLESHIKNMDTNDQMAAKQENLTSSSNSQNEGWSMANLTKKLLSTNLELPLSSSSSSSLPSSFLGAGGNYGPVEKVKVVDAIPSAASNWSGISSSSSFDVEGSKRTGAMKLSSQSNDGGWGNLDIELDSNKAKTKAVVHDSKKKGWDEWNDDDW